MQDSRRVKRRWHLARGQTKRGYVFARSGHVLNLASLLPTGRSQQILCHLHASHRMHGKKPGTHALALVRKLGAPLR
jgi:hypothetical protein